MTNSTKRCFKCDITKPFSDFYKHKNMADGHLNKCKCCTKADVAKYQKENHEKVCAYDRERFKSPERKAKVLVYQQRMRQRNKHKYVARAAVASAVRRGDLVKPKTCQSCGAGGRIEGHHHDYSKPLEVSWYCFKCHRTKGHGQRVEV